MIPSKDSVVRTIIWLGVGLVAGGSLGLFLGWVAWPTQFTEADPTILAEEYQRDYALMIAAAYSLDQDLPLARQRLAAIGKEEGDAWFLSVTVDHILGSADEQEIQQLVKLAYDLGLRSPAMTPYLAESRAEESG